MAENEAYARVDTAFGPVGLLAPLQPDVALLHAPVADRAGNVALHPPLLEGVWGALAARRGAIVTVEQVVDDLRPWSHLVRIPAHRVLAVVEAPLGAHPGGLYTGDLPVDGYGEDYDFWVDARAATRRDDYDDVDPRIGCSTSRRRSNGSTGSATSASSACAPKPRPTRGTSTRRSTPPDLDAPVNAWERAAVWGARYLADARRRARRRRGARRRGRRQLVGVARRAARAGRRGAKCSSRPRSVSGATTPTPADPFVLNHRNFPTATMLGDARDGAGRAGRWRGYHDDRMSRRRADRSQRERELHVDSRRALPRRLRWRERRREHRRRVHRRRDAHPGAHARAMWLRDLSRPRDARARHRPRRPREAGRRSSC